MNKHLQGYPNTMNKGKLIAIWAMRLPLLLLILISFLLSGCASGRFSLNDGWAKFSIPFDFPNPQKQELREKKMLEEMQRLKRETAKQAEASGMD